jgi:hypothetical protein
MMLRLRLGLILLAAASLSACTAEATREGIETGVALSEATCGVLLARRPDRVDGIGQACRKLLRVGEAIALNPG